MAKEALNKLSQLVRDRDLEIEALKMRNNDLVGLVQETSDGDNALKSQVEQLQKEKAEMYNALTQKHQESINYYAEIERLNKVLQDMPKEEKQETGGPSGNSNGATEKVVNDNSNEIIVLKSKIKELEKRLTVQVAAGSSPNRKRFYSESQQGNNPNVGGDTANKESLGVGIHKAELEGRVLEYRKSVEEKETLVREMESESLDLHRRLQEKEEELTRSCEEARGHKRKLESLVC